MLIDRCQSHGLTQTATEIESAWLGTARLLKVREDRSVQVLSGPLDLNPAAPAPQQKAHAGGSVTN